MSKNILKKNRISNVDFYKSKNYVLSKNRYYYEFIIKLSDRKIDLRKFKSIALLVLRSGGKSYLSTDTQKIKLKKIK